MKRLIVIAVLLISSLLANAEICGRFKDPLKSILKHSSEFQFDLKKLTPLSPLKASHCFYYVPRGIRCDVTYDNKLYYFIFNEKFLTAYVDSGDVEIYLLQWLRANDGKRATINTYNTLFEWDNDYEDVQCPNWHEQLTYTMTIDGKESVIIE